MGEFHDDLKIKIDQYIYLIYRFSRNFPKEEIYGITSQLRRSSMSVMLNYIEGYARGRDKVYKNFLEISYGSLKESKYLLFFSFRENYLKKEDYDKLIKLSDDIGKMLWGIIKKL
ncbi:MAG: four helix bundle protein [Patescibacteria group bacterium]